MALTTSERRAALTAALLLALGVAHDQWRAAHPALRPLVARAGARIPEPQRAPAGPRATVVEAARIDLNLASAEELDRLPGIGPVLAGRIVQYRLRHGRFTRVEELLGVRGIGPRLLERLRERVRADPAGPP